MDKQTASALKSAGDRERLEKALKRARLITLHFAASFCDAFDSDIATPLGLAPPAD